MLKRLFALILAVGCAGFLAAGCANAPLASGPNATAAKEYATISEATAQTRILLSAGKITPDQAEQVREDLNLAKSGVDAYVQTGSADSLSRARTILSAVRAILVAKGAKLSP